MKRRPNGYRFIFNEVGDMVNSKLMTRMIILTSLLLGGVYFLWLTRSALYPFMIGLLLAYMLNPVVCYFEKKNITRLWAILLLYTLLFVDSADQRFRVIWRRFARDFGSY
jgi:hypothetical protein